MPTPQQRLDLDRVMRTIDAPKAIVILMDDALEPETVVKGIADDREMFWLLAQIVRQLGEQLFAEMPGARQKLEVALPTREDAIRLGILGKARS